MGQRHVCTFRHALRAAYRTAISRSHKFLFVFDYAYLRQLRNAISECIKTPGVGKICEYRPKMPFISETVEIFQWLLWIINRN